MAWHALVVVQLHVVVERREFLIAAQQVDEGLLVGDMGGDARRLEHFQRIARQAVGLAHAAGNVARIGFDRVGRESCERKIRFQQAPCHPFVFAVCVLVIPDDPCRLSCSSDATSCMACRTSRCFAASVIRAVSHRVSSTPPVTIENWRA